MKPTYTLDATLVGAAVEGNVQRVKTLLKQQNSNVLFRDHLGRTVLHYALLLPISYDEELKNNKTIIANLFIDLNAELLGTQDEAGDTPVHFMSSVGFDGLLLDKVISDNAAVLFTPNNAGMYPIHGAIANQQHAVTKILLTVADIACLIDSKDRTLFHHAAMMNNRHVLKDLFEMPAVSLPDINHLDEDGRSALDIAKACGFEEVSDLLKKHGGKSSQPSPR